MKGTWLLTAYFLCNFSCSLHHCRFIIKLDKWIDLYKFSPQFRGLKAKIENHNYWANFMYK